MFTAIDHPAIACYDVQRQIKWYCDNLGMHVIAGGETAALVGYDNDLNSGAMIELMAKKHDGPPPIEIPTYAPGLRHLALRVMNFQKAKASLTSAGAVFLGQPGIAV